MFIGAAKKRVRLFCLLAGGGDQGERKRPLEKSISPHGQKPDLLTVPHVVSRNSMRYEYTDAVTEGVRDAIRIAPGETEREAFSSLALSPYRNSGKRLWRRPDVFPVFCVERNVERQNSSIT